MARGDSGFHVEQTLYVGNAYAHLAAGDQLLGAGNSFRTGRCEHLKPAGGVSAHGAQGGRNGEAHHAGAGDANSHAVFEDVAAYGHVNGVVGREPVFTGAVFADNFRGLGDCQGHGYRFRTPQGGFHLLMNQVNDFLFPAGHKLFSKLKFVTFLLREDVVGVFPS